MPSIIFYSRTLSQCTIYVYTKPVLLGLPHSFLIDISARRGLSNLVLTEKIFFMLFADGSRQKFQFTTELEESFGSRRTDHVRSSHVSKQTL